MQSVARRYDLVCLLHEKPFAGVNGSGKHNNWSMGTDDGRQPAGAHATPRARTCQFLFFAAAVIAAVNKHQELLRASIAGAGQDHRLGANEAPPAIISIFLGAELESVFDAIASGTSRHERGARADAPGHPGAAGPARRTPATATAPARSPSPATSSSSGPSAPASRRASPTRSSTRSSPSRSTRSARTSRRRWAARRSPPRAWTRPSTSVIAAQLQGRTGGSSSAATTTPRSGTRRPRSAGSSNLRTTPDALPELISDDTVAAFSNYGVLVRARAPLALRRDARAVHHHGEHGGRDGRGHRRHDDPAGRGPAPGDAERGRPDRAREGDRRA